MYRCCCCLSLCKYEMLSYEITHNTDLSLIGICKKCNQIPKNQWKKQIDLTYMVAKIHTYSKEYNEYWKMVNDKVPNWIGYYVTMNGTIFMYDNNKEILLAHIPDDKCICCT